jgi:DNA-binding Lrp family transcriptional regulator
MRNSSLSPQDLSILGALREEIKQAIRVIAGMTRVTPQVLRNQLYYRQTELGPTKR